MKEFLIRTASGLTYAALMVGSVTLHPLFFLAVFLLVLGLGLYEYYHFEQKMENRGLVVPGMLTGMMFFTTVFFMYYSGISYLFLGIPVFSLMVVLTIPMFRKGGNILYSQGHTLSGLIYVALPVTLMNGLVFHPYAQGFDYQVALFLFAVIWINDTGAYIFGVLFGKHKMFPRISPKKSWEGLAGGLLVSLGAGMLIKPLVPDIPANQILLLATAAVIAGTLGDLAESALKRSAGVKDSGRIMPGHGGILDRFDSLLFAIPVLFFLIRILPN